MANQISPYKGRRPGDAGRQGRVRCPRAKPHQLCSRAVRASCLPALRPACEVRRWKWGAQATHEAWPGSHQGTTHPLGRAVVERRQASAPESGRGGASRLIRGATRAPYSRAGTDDSATAGVPLPLLLSSLRATRSNPVRPLSFGLLRRGACHRAGHLGQDPLAPRNDDLKRWLFDKTRALVRRGNGLLFRLCPAGRRSARFQRLT